MRASWSNLNRRSPARVRKADGVTTFAVVPNLQNFQTAFLQLVLLLWLSPCRTIVSPGFTGHLLIYNNYMENNDREIEAGEKITEVISVEPVDNYRLRIGLSNGRKGIFDVSPYVDKGVFNELKDQAYFRSVRTAFGGIMWPQQQDFSAETIEYELQKEGDHISKGGR